MIIGEKYTIVRVTRTDDYLIPLHGAVPVTKINGWTIDEVCRSWFDDFDINRSHATRDAYRLGNGGKIIDYKIADQETSHPQFAFEGNLAPFDVEDGGQAIIAEIDNGSDSGMFVRIQSWDDTREHNDIRRLEGKRVRVTIEVLD